MPRIRLGERSVTAVDGETVLDALLREGIDVPHSCKKGVCHACLLRSPERPPPAGSQEGLSPTLRALGYFLPCVCPASDGLLVMQPAAGDVHVSARVVSKELVGEDICRLRLLPSRSFPYRAGQYLSLRRADGLTRSYSLASVPRIDAFLELHIRRMEGGQMTTYLFDELEAGDSVQFFGPSGSCFYLPGREDAPLLLIGAGTGLSTVVGIARDALTTGHTGPVRLYHGSATRAGLYLDRELKRLEVLYPNLRYTPCLDGAEKAEGCRSGRVTDVAFGEHPNLSGWRVYVSGTAPMVHAAKRRAYLMGASLADLHADPFEHATPPAPGPRQASPWRENRRPCRTGRADCALSCSIHG